LKRLPRAEVDGRGPEGLSTDSPCYQIVIRPEGEEDDTNELPSAHTRARDAAAGCGVSGFVRARNQR
jgi:hypothetical protein